MASRQLKEEMELLKDVPLFSFTAKKQRREIAEACEHRSVRAGKVLTQQGKQGRDFFVVLSGTARCEVDGREIRKFERGSFFGELALVTGAPRSATIIAETPMELLVLDRREFMMLLRSASDVTIKVLTSVAVRLQQADQQVTH
jgi:CRP-like cAMP-binding protein